MVQAVLDGLAAIAGEAHRPHTVRQAAFAATTARGAPQSDAALSVLTTPDGVAPGLLIAAAEAAARAEDPRARAPVARLMRTWHERLGSDTELEESMGRLLVAAAALQVGEAATIVKKLLRKGSASLRIAATRALPALGAEAPAKIRTALRHRVWRMRWAAIDACRRWRSAKAVDLLIERLPKEKGRLRRDLLAALHELTGTAIPYSPADWKKWWSHARASFDPKAARRTGGSTVVSVPSQGQYFGFEVVSDRVTFIVDVSGSMTTRLQYDGKTATRIEIMQDQLLELIADLTNDTRLNVYFFRDTYDRLFRSLKRVSKSGRRLVEAFVRRSQARGGTNIYDPLANALHDDNVDTIYLLSDGDTGSGKFVDTKDILRAIRRLNRSRMVQINTIAIGKDSELLRELARANFGTYINIR